MATKQGGKTYKSKKSGELKSIKKGMKQGSKDTSAKKQVNNKSSAKKKTVKPSSRFKDGTPKDKTVY